MTTDTYIVFGILVVTIGLFISDRIRLDLVSLLALLALLLTRVLEPEEALQGFSDPIVLMIAGLFVIGGGLLHTGVADRLGRWLGRKAGSSEARLVAVIMLVTAPLSAFMSSTGTVAVMLPVVVMLARNAKVSPSKLLIPLAFASLFGGMLTLIGTPPNIVVSNLLREQGHEAFRFFSFTPIGLLMTALGLVYLLIVGRRLLPATAATEDASSQRGPEKLSGTDLVADYNLSDNILQFRLDAGHDLIGKTLAQADVRSRFQGTVLDIRRAGAGDEAPQSQEIGPETILQPGDVLSVQISEDALDEVKQREAGSMVQELAGGAPLPRHTILVEVLLTPRSSLIGKRLKDTRFRDRYHANVLSIRRAGKPIPGNPADVSLRFGDTLLVEGGRRDIAVLREQARDFVVVAEPRELSQIPRNDSRALVAVAIMVAMLVLMTFKIVPNVTAVILAAVAMVLTGCLSMTEAYRAINLQSVVLIAAILPVATALEKTGGMQLMVDGLTGALGGAGPLLVMGTLFVLTSVFSQVISNTATTILVAPIALQIAVRLGASPQAFLMTVAIAASTAFATPIASPVNTLVLDQGRYRFVDFVKVGVPLQLLILIATLLVVPLWAGLAYPR